MNFKKTLFLVLLIVFFFAPFIQAGVIINYPKFMAWDANGKPLNGGKLYTYINGTTTSKATYTTKACTVANTNPVILNSRGEATVYGIGTYTLVLKTSTGTTIWTEDDIQGLPDSGTNYYYPDSTETDQGATGLGASAKAYADLITTKNAGMFFKQGSAVSGTTYTFSTSLTFPSNIELYFDKGAIMNIASGVTVTIYSPANLKGVIPNQQIKTGNGALIYTVPFGLSYNVWTGGTLSKSSLMSGFDLIPSGLTTYDLGSGTTKWNTVYSNNLKLLSGTTVNNISTDVTLSGNTDTAIPTEAAIKSYVDSSILSNYYKYKVWVGPPGSYTSGQTNTTSAYCISATATELVLTNVSNQKILASGVSVTANITVSGANGLNVGETESGSTTYNLFVCRYYSGTTYFALLSTSGTTPLGIPDNTYKRNIGEVANNSSSNFVLFSRRDNFVKFYSPITYYANVTLRAATDTWDSYTLPNPLYNIDWDRITFLATGVVVNTSSAPIISGTTVPSIAGSAGSNQDDGTTGIYYGLGFDPQIFIHWRIGSGTTLYIHGNSNAALTGCNLEIIGYERPI